RNTLARRSVHFATIYGLNTNADEASRRETLFFRPGASNHVIMSKDRSSTRRLVLITPGRRNICYRRSEKRHLNLMDDGFNGSRYETYGGATLGALDCSRNYFAPRGWSCDSDHGKLEYLGERTSIAKDRRRLRPSGPHSPQYESSRPGGNGSGFRLSA